MIISRTPLRISFVGGGSDLPAFYREHGGAVLSMSIQKYIYLSMHAYFEQNGYILKYSNIESPSHLSEIKHRIIKQVFTDFNINGVDFNSSADVPAGTGMGSSSAFTVGLLNLCYAYLGRHVPRVKLAQEACEVEIEKLGEPIGKQDQYGCALGGINLIEFHPDNSVAYDNIALTREQKTQLQNNLLLFYLGGTRSASEILKVQSSNSASNEQAVANLKAMVAQAYELRRELSTNIDVLGPYLHEGWQRKRTLASGISNPLIDHAYDRALAAGATGGKLLGAGGAGFLLVYAPANAHDAVIESLQDFNLHRVNIDESGASIIYSD
jgi:D-glycero-alpha-D-manno-heptose-7-phosphate kinase